MRQERPLVLERALVGSHPTALRIEQGRILAVGAPAAPRPGDEVVDLGGRRVLPGLRDAHVHFTQWALSRTQTDVSGAHSASHAADLVGRAARAHGSDAFLRGNGFHDGLWPDVPHKALLDAAAPGVPVLLISHDSHTVWLSSAGLDACGLDHPTGLLRERDAWRAMRRVPPPKPDEADAAVARPLRTQPRSA